MRKRKSGFTLIELMLVIGIISVIVSVMLPAMQKARSQSQLQSCLSNLKTIGTAAEMWKIDNPQKSRVGHDGDFSEARTLVPKYMGKFPVCPSTGVGDYAGGKGYRTCELSTGKATYLYVICIGGHKDLIPYSSDTYGPVWTPEKGVIIGSPF
ncbi:MAG: type II secretion system GspH family protein [Firmicutes bacterium]|nr:type II secretion system GspH family protein [Bacillota bacterium]